LKAFFARTYRWEYFWLCLIVLVSLALHFSIITNPAELVLDEEHYVNDARNIIEDAETKRLEHPPLAKLFIVAGIEIFGDNQWGWRFFSVLFGTAGIVLFYFLCRRLNMSNTAASIAAFLLAFENMTFVQASVAMLDVYYLTFMIGAFLLYAARRYINAGIAVGLSALSKILGLLAWPVMALHWLFTPQGRSRMFILSLLTTVLAFMLLMIVFDLAIVRDFADLKDPVSRIETMLTKSGSLTFETVEHSAASRPWEWVFSYTPMAFRNDPTYSSAISPLLWALIVPTFGYMIYRAVKGSSAGLFGAAWFTGIYLAWIPFSLITNRVSYPFYFYPAVGAVCIGLGMALSQLIDLFRQRPSGKLKWTSLSIVVFYLVAHMVTMIICSPLVPLNIAQLRFSFW
jgi:dolichyl-phosphate-mannose-protein mannosyltransferase